MKTAVIGLGAMGMGMALNLHKAGQLHTFWNRSPERAAALAEQTGLAAASSVAELAEQSDLIITCVSRDADLLEVIEAMQDGLQRGSIVVDTSTVSADTAKQLATLLQPAGVEFLDAPVSGGVEGAKNGSLAMMIGGDASTLDKARSSLDCIAANIVHMGPTGSGQATKAVNQIMAAGINQAVTEALAFGQAMQLDMDKVIDVVGSGAAANWFLDHRGKTMVKQSFKPGFKLALHHKDLTICKELAKNNFAAQLPTVDMTLADYQELIDQGFGEDDISSLFRLKKNLLEKP